MPRRLPLLLLAVAASGCFGTSPPARFYVLSPSPEARQAAATPGREGILGVMPARIPEYVDRPQIVTLLGENAVSIDEYARWAEPVSAGLSRVLAQDLASELPQWRVVQQPWDPVLPLRAEVVLDVAAVGWTPEGEVRLDATWAVLTTPGAPPAARGRFTLRRAATAKGTDAAIATASALVAELAREIAVAVRTLPPAR